MFVVDVVFNLKGYFVNLVILYFQNDLEVGVTDSTNRSALLSEMESLLQKSALCRKMQELIGYYLLLERYYMEQSVKKAVTMDTVEQGSQISSMVDDVFFIVRKCIR